MICRRFLEAWAPVLGDELANAYHRDRDGWERCAERLLERHTHHRLQAAFEHMLADEIIGSQATTLPGFERVVDRLLARRHARPTTAITDRSHERQGLGAGSQRA